RLSGYSSSRTRIRAIPPPRWRRSASLRTSNAHLTVTRCGRTSRGRSWSSRSWPTHCACPATGFASSRHRAAAEASALSRPFSRTSFYSRPSAARPARPSSGSKIAPSISQPRPPRAIAWERSRRHSRRTASSRDCDSGTARTWAPTSARPSPPPSIACTPPSNGCYKAPNISIDNELVVTNCTPVGLNRGYGGPQFYFALERVMDIAARGLGMDPAELRRRNFIPADAFPYRAPAGAIFDAGDYDAALSELLRIADYDEL